MPRRIGRPTSPDAVSTETVSYPTKSAAPTRPRALAKLKLERLLAFPELLGLLAVAGVLNLWGLSSNGWANTYYSAAVRSMASSWHAFLYASLDRAGVQTVGAGSHASKIQGRLAWPERDIADARQELGVVVEIRDLQLVELLAVQYGEADGHPLQVFRALLRSNGDFFQRTILIGR